MMAKIKCSIKGCKEEPPIINLSIGLEICSTHHNPEKLKGIPKFFLDEMLKQYEIKNKKTDK